MSLNPGGTVLPLPLPSLLRGFPLEDELPDEPEPPEPDEEEPPAKFPNFSWAEGTLGAVETFGTDEVVELVVGADDPFAVFFRKLFTPLDVG